jgi:hypothetical protein
MKHDRIEGRDMAKIRTRIAAIGLGIAFMIGANLTVCAEGAPVPARVPPPPSGQPQPTPPAPAKGITVTLHCGVAGISTSLFSMSGLRCPSPNPTSAGKCYYVILEGWGPGAAADSAAFPQGAWNQIDFTCTAEGLPDVTGIYSGASAEPGGNVTYRSADSTQVCVSKFPNTVGLIPANTELVVKGPLPCM